MSAGVLGLESCDMGDVDDFLLPPKEKNVLSDGWFGLACGLALVDFFLFLPSTVVAVAKDGFTDGTTVICESTGDSTFDELGD